jgi:hypothetical protein
VWIRISERQISADQCGSAESENTDFFFFGGGGAVLICTVPDFISYTNFDPDPDFDKLF